MTLGGGEREQEGAAVAEFAFGADRATVGEHDVFGDGEAESGAAGFAGAGFVDAIEALEKPGQGPPPRRMLPPVRPYFMALSMRFEKTWWMASRSARTAARVSIEIFLPLVP